MPIPQYKNLRYAFLEYASDGQGHNIGETIEALESYFELTEDERHSLLANGRDYKFRYMARWAKTYLTKAKLIDSTGRGTYLVTQRGLEFLKQITTGAITKNDLLQFPEFAGFAAPSDTESSEAEVSELEIDQSPAEVFAVTYEQLYKTLSDELLETVVSVTPTFFERLVLDLLLKMGYGSSLDSGQHTGQSGDGGIDGLIREDKLGLDTIYIQAKRYARDNGVSRSDVQSFVGSLMGLGASKGVFITTSYFTQQTIEYAKNVKNAKVILIDGQQLATLMIEHNVGVAIQKVYEIKQVDENYFPNA